MSFTHFSNYRIKEDTHYFLYVGELKNYGLNVFLKEALTRIHKQKFDFIAIVPDVCEQYNYENLIVINPLKDTFECQYGSSVNCRVSASNFAATVSDDPQVKTLIDDILKRQPEVFVYMYESLHQLSLDDINGVTILGPDKQIARKMNNKTFQMSNLNQLVPVVDFRVCDGIKALQKKLQ